MRKRFFILALLAFSLAANRPARAEGWELLQMDHGGVVEDMQLVYHANPATSRDQVWAACMNGGIYRSTWNTGSSAWNTFSQYIPGKKAFGIDAIEVNGTEYVLCASQGLGLRYTASSSSSFSPTWDWPNGQAVYPDAWKHCGTNDAAFYWPSSGTPGNPQQQFYVILTGAVDETPQPDAGLWRWNNTSGQEGFLRLTNQPAGAHAYSHFYRDLRQPNVLYVIKKVEKDEDDAVISSGMLYRINGTYGSETVTLLTDTTSTVNNNNYVEVCDLGQWYESDSSTTYYYLLMHEVRNGAEVYKVYVTTTLPNNDWDIGDFGNAIYTKDRSEDGGRDWTDIYASDLGAKVIGRPFGEIHHKLWLCEYAYGWWYVETTSPVFEEQINDGNGATNLKRWRPRSAVPDIDHFATGETMRILFGTHQAGVWYLQYSNPTPSSSH
jgi:hypothetical protein